MSELERMILILGIIGILAAVLILILTGNARVG